MVKCGAWTLKILVTILTLFFFFFIASAAGPLFRVPVTVIRPETKIQANYLLNFKSGTIHRRFLSIPPGTTSAG